MKPPFHLRTVLKIQADYVEHPEFLASKVAP